MLLKYSKFQQRTKLTASGKPQRSTGYVKAVNGKGKGHRKGVKGAANKRIKAIAFKREEVPPVTVDPCDNSNDSGLGFDHHLDFPVPRTQSSFIEPEVDCWSEREVKRQRLDVKVECDNANDNFTFPQTRIVQQPSTLPICHKGGKPVSAGKGKRNGLLYNNQSVGASRDGKVQLQILSQPEMQHRARYQTEGSRGAVKDRTGNSFPIVKLSGYNKPTTLEVYIGTDQGRVAPHMFYQACRVSGKNSTPCIEKKVNGTVLIEIELDPAKDMIATCDCVGILKERNVDVEHRFPEESSGRSKKKSTRCRMVFKTVIINSDNTTETLQVTSQPIICTQPPGVPEICKKSLSSCSAAGGLELFILGKNFLKDTKVVFSEGDYGTDSYWEAVVSPDKEFLQQSHLVCVIPSYRQEHIKEAVAVRLNIVSSDRTSESHTFMYTPIGTPPTQVLSPEPNIINRAIAPTLSSVPTFPAQNLLLGVPLILPSNHLSMPAPTPFIPEETGKCKEESNVFPVSLMRPPATLPPRRPSQPVILGDPPLELKREAESPSPPQQINTTSDLSASQPPSMATLRRFVSTPNTPLPALSVDTFFSNIENKPLTTETTSSFLVQKPNMNLIQSPGKRHAVVSNGYSAQINQQPLLQTSLSTNDLLRSQTIQDEIAASIIANSPVENHISPGHSNMDRTSDVIPKEEIILHNVLNDVTMPMQTSPLNLNAHETISHSPPLPMKRMTSMETKMLSPNLPSLCISQPSLPLVNNPLGNETGDMMMNANFSPGKDIRTVTNTINMNVDPITTNSFVTNQVNQSSSSSEMIMKAVVNDLAAQAPQFSTSQQLNMQTTIKDVLASQNATNQLQNSLLLSSNFSSQTSADSISINTSQVGSNYITTESMGESVQCVQNTSHFGSTMISPSFVQETSLNGNDEKPQTNESSLTSSGETNYSSNLLFPPSSEMRSVNDSLKPTQSNSPQLSPRFSPNIVYQSTPNEMPVSNDNMSPGFQTVGDTVKIKTECFSQSVNNTDFRTAESSLDNAIMKADPLNINNQKLESVEQANTTTPTFQSNVILDRFNSNETSSSVMMTGKTIAEPIVSSKPFNQTLENGSTQVPKQVATVPGGQVKKCEEGIPLPQELTQMSEHDLLSYINPSCFDQV